MGRAKSNIIDFVKNIKSWIITNGVFADSTCNLSLDNSFLEYPPSDVYCLITPKEFTSWQRSTDGGGTEAMVLVGTILFTIWFNNAMDEANRDTTVLTNNTIGLYETIDDLISVLQMLDVCHNIDDGYLAEPMRLIRIGKPIRDEKHHEWVRVDNTYEVKIWNKI